MTNETKSPAQSAPVVAASELSDDHIAKMWHAAQDQAVSGIPAPIHLARAVLAAATAAASVPDESAAKAVHWFGCLEKCARLLGLPDDEPIPSGVVAAVERLFAAPAVQQPAEGGWISVETRLPEGRYCLAVYVNSHGRQNIIRAMYVRQFEMEATGDECDSEYNEANDTEYLKAGWLECIDNWGEYSSVYVTEGAVTHWMPLPPLPAAPTQAEGHSHD